MTLSDYKKAMAEMGISRGGFEDEGEIDHIPCGTNLKSTKEPKLLDPTASLVVDKPPIADVDEKFKCTATVAQTAKAWWASLSPEERAEQSKQRSINGRKAWKSKGA